MTGSRLDQGSLRGPAVVSGTAPVITADGGPSAAAASTEEASAAPTAMATLAKVASQTEWRFHVPMDEATKAAALGRGNGVGLAVEALSSPAQRALLEAARGLDLARAASGLPNSPMAQKASRQMENNLDQRIASLKDVFRLGKPNAAEQELSEMSQQLTSVMSKLVDGIGRAGKELDDMSRSLREAQLSFAGYVQASPQEQIDAARSELDKQCGLLIEDAKNFSRLTEKDQKRLARKWRQALSLAAEARLEVLGASSNSSPALNYFRLLSQIQDFRTIKDSATQKKVLTDCQNAKRNWPAYVEEVHGNAWSSWADIKGALALSKLAERPPGARQRIDSLLILTAQQLGSMFTRYELKPPPRLNLKAQESFDKLDGMLRTLVDQPDIHIWQDAFSGESAEVINEASKFAATALAALMGFGPKVDAIHLKPWQRIQRMRATEIAQKKLDAEETTFYASAMARMAHMAQTLKGELEAIDACVADQAADDPSQDNKGKGRQTLGGHPELRLQLQTLMQPLDVIEGAAKEFLALLVPDVTEEDFSRLAGLARPPVSDASSVADPDDIGDMGSASSVREPSSGGGSQDDATEAKEHSRGSTLSDHLKGLKPPRLDVVAPEKDVDPITFQQMKAVVDPFLKLADESWSKAQVALKNHDLASFDRKKRQQLVGCSNELKQAGDALAQARTAYKERIEADERAGVARAFSLLEDKFTEPIGLYKKATRWVKNWADGPESRSFTERVRQGHLVPRFGKDSSDEGFCFQTRHGWTVEALAPQAPITRWDGAKENRAEVAFHFHFHLDCDPTSIPMSEVTQDMLTVMTVKQKEDRFVTHRKDQDGNMQHVPEVVVPQNEAWEVFKRVVQSGQPA